MWKLVLLCVSIQVIGSSGRDAKDPEDLALRTIINNGIEFSNRFYEATPTAATTKNFISSPISALSTLSLLAFGARNDTQIALKKVLNFNEDDSIQRQGLKTIFDDLNESHSVNLKIANKLFVVNTVEIKPEFQKLSEDILKSSVEKLDFSETDNATKIINEWCEQQTEHKIKDIIENGTINSDTRILLVNAVYFKAKWATSFSRRDTRDDVFYLDDGTTKNVSTMHIQTKYNYGVLADFKAQFAELPYRGREISMFIIRPDEINGLKNLQQNISQLNFSRLLTQGESTRLIFSLPKFEIETTIDLQEPLAKLGMSNIFESTADISGISDSPLYVNEAIQKAYIKIDEQGTEAAAITSAVGAVVRRRPRKVQFIVDRPFYYAIVKRIRGSRDSGVVLFQGHYTGKD